MGQTAPKVPAGTIIEPSKSFDALLKIYEGEMMGAVNAMPADKYNFAPSAARNPASLLVVAVATIDPKRKGNSLELLPSLNPLPGRPANRPLFLAGRRNNPIHPQILHQLSIVVESMRNPKRRHARPRRIVLQ